MSQSRRSSRHVAVLTAGVLVNAAYIPQISCYSVLTELLYNKNYFPLNSFLVIHLSVSTRILNLYIIRTVYYMFENIALQINEEFVLSTTLTQRMIYEFTCILLPIQPHEEGPFL